MKAKEFGGWKWQAQNIPGQHHQQNDEFNSHLKQERRPDPPEYACRDVEEYKKYPETKDVSNLQEELRKKQDVSSDGNGSNASNSSGRLQSNMLRQVVGLVAGSVVLVGTYQAVETQQAAAQELQDPTEIVIETQEPSEIEEPPEESGQPGPGGTGESQVPDDTPSSSEVDPGQQVDPTEEVDPCEVNGHTYKENGTTNENGKITIHYICSECGEEKELVITYNIEPEE